MHELFFRGEEKYYLLSSFYVGEREFSSRLHEGLSHEIFLFLKNRFEGEMSKCVWKRMKNQCAHCKVENYRRLFTAWNPISVHDAWCSDLFLFSSFVTNIHFTNSKQHMKKQSKENIFKVVEREKFLWGKGKAFYLWLDSQKVVKIYRLVPWSWLGSIYESTTS